VFGLESVIRRVVVDASRLFSEVNNFGDVIDNNQIRGLKRMKMVLTNLRSI
jgi:hypothetical protein